MLMCVAAAAQPPYRYCACLRPPGISYFGWNALHYFNGYALIIVIEAVILGCGLGLRRHRLSVEVHDERLPKPQP